MIEFNQVYIKYINDFYSLYNFSCEINSHTLFVGDFYSGTTAIMRTMCGIDKHYSGDIYIDEINIKYIKDKNLKIAYLPHIPVVFKNKNIFKNLYFPLKIRKINKTTAKSLIYGIFEELKKENLSIFNNLNLEKFLKLKTKKLNLTQQKIIALIRSILWQPKYILLEDFFKDFNAEYLDTANYLINKIKTTSTLVAAEENVVEIFKDF